MECGLNDTILLLGQKSAWVLRWKVAAACPRNGVFPGYHFVRFLWFLYWQGGAAGQLWQLPVMPLYQHTAYVSSLLVGLDSSVGIATGYGLGGPGIESRLGRDFSHPPGPAVRPTHPPVQWVPALFPGGKAAEAWSLPPPPAHKALRLTRIAVPHFPLCAFMTRCRVNFTFTIIAHSKFLMIVEEIFLFQPFTA
jgi:hypothetical protein